MLQGKLISLFVLFVFFCFFRFSIASQCPPQELQPDLNNIRVDLELFQISPKDYLTLLKNKNCSKTSYTQLIDQILNPPSLAQKETPIVRTDFPSYNQVIGFINKLKPYINTNTYNDLLLKIKIFNSVLDYSDEIDLILNHRKLDQSQIDRLINLLSLTQKKYPFSFLHLSILIKVFSHNEFPTFQIFEHLKTINTLLMRSSISFNYFLAQITIPLSYKMLTTLISRIFFKPTEFNKLYQETFNYVYNLTKIPLLVDQIHPHSSHLKKLPQIYLHQLDLLKALFSNSNSNASSPLINPLSYSSLTNQSSPIILENGTLPNTNFLYVNFDFEFKEFSPILQSLQLDTPPLSILKYTTFYLSNFINAKWENASFGHFRFSNCLLTNNLFLSTSTHSMNDFLPSLEFENSILDFTSFESSRFEHSVEFFNNLIADLSFINTLSNHLSFSNSSILNLSFINSKNLDNFKNGKIEFNTINSSPLNNSQFLFQSSSSNKIELNNTQFNSFQIKENSLIRNLYFYNTQINQLIIDNSYIKTLNFNKNIKINQLYLNFDSNKIEDFLNELNIVIAEPASLNIEQLIFSSSFNEDQIIKLADILKPEAIAAGVPPK